MFDTVRKAFGLVRHDVGEMDLSRLATERPLLSLTTTQGLVLWAGFKVQWNLWCQPKYKRVCRVLEEFIAGWAMVVRHWRSERDVSCLRGDLCHLVGALND